MQIKEQNISPIKQRILTFADTLGISKRNFYATIGVSRGTLESKTGITEEVMAKFIATYPQVSIEWLLTGAGHMIKSSSTESDQAIEYTESHRIDIPTRPRIPFNAAAGALSVAIGAVTEEECERLPLIPTLPEYDFTIPIKGDSMMPDFHSGDEVACRFINEASFIQWGYPHVLDTAQGVVLKSIYQDEDNIICKSLNPRYPDFTIPKNEILHMAIVVGFIRQS